MDAAHEIAGMDLNDIYAITRSDQLIDWLDHIKAVHAGFEAKTQLGLARKERVLPKQMELVHNFYFHRDRYLRNAVHSDERNSEEFDRVHDQTICSATLQSWKRVALLVIHSMLHLNGMHHGRTMERRLEKVLQAFGFDVRLHEPHTHVQTHHHRH